MKRNMIYVLCMLLAAFAFALPFARGSREIDLDTLKKPLAPYVTDMEKKDAAWLRKQYHLDSAAYEQALVYGAASAMEVNEIAVFKGQDEAGSASKALSGAYKPAAEKLSGLCAQTECTIGKSRRLRGWALCRCPDSSAAVPAAAAVEEGLVTVL